MKRPLAVLVATAVALLGILVPAVAASADAATYGFSAQAKWVNGTLTVVYSWDGLPADATSGVLNVRRRDDFVVVSHEAATDAVATSDSSVPGAKSVTLTADVNVCRMNPDPTTSEPVCTDEVIWTKTVARHTYKRKPTQISASAALSRLAVAAESHASTYVRSKFKLWIDANNDGENTRAEVLVAESKKKVTENSHHTVKTGKWVSPYDGKTYTVASNLDIDHLVPLEEAWTSGAYKWSAKKREAYANDLGYAASLIAVSQHAKRSKGDEEPNAYLPPKTSYVCTYVKNYIAVKYRWGLKIDSTEKASLRLDLAQYCMNPYVKNPGRPNINALVGKTTKKSSGGGSSSGGGTHYARGVHPGAFCSPDGAFGYTTAGTLMQCKTTATDSRDRWRRA